MTSRHVENPWNLFTGCSWLSSPSDARQIHNRTCRARRLSLRHRGRDRKRRRSGRRRAFCHRARLPLALWRPSQISARARQTRLPRDRLSGSPADWLAPAAERLEVRHLPHLASHLGDVDAQNGGATTEDLVDTGNWKDRCSAQRYVHATFDGAWHFADKLPTRKSGSTKKRSMIANTFLRRLRSQCRFRRLSGHYGRWRAFWYALWAVI